MRSDHSQNLKVQLFIEIHKEKTLEIREKSINEKMDKSSESNSNKGESSVFVDDDGIPEFLGVRQLPAGSHAAAARAAHHACNNRFDWHDFDAFCA